MDGDVACRTLRASPAARWQQGGGNQASGRTGERLRPVARFPSRAWFSWAGGSAPDGGDASHKPRRSGRRNRRSFGRNRAAGAGAGRRTRDQLQRFPVRQRQPLPRVAHPGVAALFSEALLQRPRLHRVSERWLDAARGRGVARRGAHQYRALAELRLRRRAHGSGGRPSAARDTDADRLLRAAGRPLRSERRGDALRRREQHLSGHQRDRRDGGLGRRGCGRGRWRHLGLTCAPRFFWAPRPSSF